MQDCFLTEPFSVILTMSEVHMKGHKCKKAMFLLSKVDLHNVQVNLGKQCTWLAADAGVILARLIARGHARLNTLCCMTPL